MIAEVIIESNVKTLNRHFDYNIPKEMENIVNDYKMKLVEVKN